MEKISVASYFQDEIEHYGLDWDGPLPESDSDETIELPLMANPLNQQQSQDLTQTINPMRNSDCYGIDIFIETLTFVASRLAM